MELPQGLRGAVRAAVERVALASFPFENNEPQSVERALWMPTIAEPNGFEKLAVPSQSPPVAVGDRLDLGFKHWFNREDIGGEMAEQDSGWSGTESKVTVWG